MEEENKVSVWTGKLENEDNFNAYISLTYNDDGDMVSAFMADFEIDYYDTQFQEALFDSSGDKNEIFKDFSYIKNFLSKIPVLHGSNCFILLYNFNYKGNIKNAGDFKYVGSFDYR